MTARHAALLAAAALSIAAARFASAAAAVDGRLRVLIVIDESDDPFAERIKAEVSALGFEVVSVEPWRTGEAVESLDAAGRANQAAAAIRMIASRKGVEVWMANQPTGRSLMRQLVVDERPVPNEGLVALQTAELLRTTLLSRSELAARSRPHRRPSNRPIEMPIAPPGPPTASLQAARGPLYSPGSSITMQVWGTAQQCRRPALRPRAGRQRAVAIRHDQGPEGSASVRWWLFGAAAFMRYDRPEKPAVRHCRRRRRGDSPQRDRDRQRATARQLREHDGRRNLRPRRRRHRGDALAALRRARGRRSRPQGVLVRFAGNEAARWGLPFLAVLRPRRPVVVVARYGSKRTSSIQMS